DSGVIGAGGDGNLLADLERGPLAIGGADVGILKDARVRVREQSVESRAADTHRKVGSVEMGERVEGEVGRRCRRVSSTGTGAGACRRRSRSRLRRNTDLLR